MKPHLLLATDFSEEARAVYPRVRRLADSLGAQLTLVHVVREFLAGTRGLPSSPDTDLTPNLELLERAQAGIREELGRVGGDPPPSGTVLQAKDLSRGIAAHAAEVGATMICLATHGEGGFRRFLLGSTLEGVMRHSTVPVLAFPSQERPEPLESGQQAPVPKQVRA